MSEKIKVIKCLSEEHGKRIIEYLESIGGRQSKIGPLELISDWYYGINSFGTIVGWEYIDISKFEIIELPELISDLERLKRQKAAIEKRIKELEKQETFDSILNKIILDKILEEEEDYGIEAHSKLYEKLKRIENYVNKKFGGKIDWEDSKSTKHGVYYEYDTDKINKLTNNSCIQASFYLVTKEAYEYFIKVTGEHLVNFFKTTH